jgi:hypothetical protein
MELAKIEFSKISGEKSPRIARATGVFAMNGPSGETAHNLRVTPALLVSIFYNLKRNFDRW